MSVACNFISIVVVVVVHMGASNKQETQDAGNEAAIPDLKHK